MFNKRSSSKMSLLDPAEIPTEKWVLSLLFKKKKLSFILKGTNLYFLCSHNVEQVYSEHLLEKNLDFWSKKYLLNLFIVIIQLKSSLPQDLNWTLTQTEGFVTHTQILLYIYFWIMITHRDFHVMSLESLSMLFKETLNTENV